MDGDLSPSPVPELSKEVDLLSRVAVNHLFLGQFEPLRAALLSLRRRDPNLALSILRTVVLEGGDFEGVLCSSTCRSPAHLAWLSVLDLLEFENLSSLIGGFDHETLRLKVEFLLLAQIVCSNVGEDGSGEVLDRARWILDFGLRVLKSGGGEVSERGVGLGAQEVLIGLKKVILEQADGFDVLCWNIDSQVHRCPEPSELKFAISVSGEVPESSDASAGEFEALVEIQRTVQLAHLSALKEDSESGDMDRAISHIRYLHLYFGVEESEYRIALKALIKKFWEQKDGFGEAWYLFRNEMLMVHGEAFSANCVPILQIIQAIQDELLNDEIEQNQHIVSDSNLIPLPLQKYLEALKLGPALDDHISRAKLSQACMRDLYHYARISGSNILECVMDCALSAVRREQLQEACDVLSLFPLLQPLVAAMGWDLLSGKTAARRKLLQILWTSKSQVLRLEESFLYEKQSDEMSCVEYLCDLLCFHLDVASFVACVNSGRDWNSKDSILFSRKQQIDGEDIDEQSDPFVENFVLERLAIQTPLRVLFDVVPGIKFQDAIELISMQPTNSTSVAWKRFQDIELMHLRYALESALLALGAMERCTDDEKEKFYREAIWHLKNLKNHLEAVSSIPRKVFMLSIVMSLLHMDTTYVNLAHCASSSSYSAALEQPDLTYSCDGDSTMVVSFIGLLLDILHCSLPTVAAESDHSSRIRVVDAGKQALEWRIANIKYFIEDWSWRLSILQKLLPLSGHPWSWKEALAVLRAAPSNLLNLCMQRAKYDIGEEAVHRFSLPAEDKAALELTEWVAGAFKKASVEDSVSRAAEGVSNAFQELDFSSICSQLGPLSSVLLCIDVASTSAKSANMCLPLLNEASSIFSKIYPGGSPKIGSAYWDQLKEVAIISVIRRVLQRLRDLLEQEKAPSLREIFAGETYILPSMELSKQGQRQCALALLHQMIDDAHKGKRQFLSGKLHNLARVVADEDTDDEKKKLLSLEKGAVLGLGLRPLKPTHIISASAEDGANCADYDANDTEEILIGSLNSKLSTYISSFIIYIATIGDIVDGIDTTHDFNFFSLVYEWPKDLLNRLVFERGSTDAAAKIADIMCSDFVHEVISACVPPVFPPCSGHGWACIPRLPSLSKTMLENMVSPKEARSISNISFSVTLDATLYPLNLDIVKHLAKLSPVRAILACVFGSSIFSSCRSTSITSGFNAKFVQAPDAERSFYEFALDQSERFPTLNRWIQMQSNLHKVSESAIGAASDAKPKAKVSVKRSREPGSDTESDIDEMAGGNLISMATPRDDAEDYATSDACQELPKSASIELESTSFISLDWENEEPYKKAVERLISEGKLMDALALSDRFLRDGASDHLLQLLIECGEENPLTSGQSPGSGVHNLYVSNWQYCLRLKDKGLAAKLALKYLHYWELNTALDVLTMCICHLPQRDPIRNEVWQMRQALEKYNRILCADDSHKCWQGVETEYKEDPEGLALRLAGKGAVSAALEVAESAALSIDLRRELQGRQLVKLLTADPLSGGGPAEASRFLSLLCDPDDALPVAMGAMQLLPDLHSKQLLVHFFLKRRAGNLSDVEITRLNSWALGLHVLAVLPLPWQQRCSALHEHPHLILEVLLMMKQLQYASLMLKEFPSLRNDNLILAYSAKAISVCVCSSPREPRMSVSGPRTRQKTKTNFLTSSLSNLHKEARRAFSWAPRDTASKASPKEAYRKRKSSGLTPPERVSWEAMSSIQEEHVSVYSADGQERVPFVPVAEEWVLTGDSSKDDAVRLSHRYESSPDIVLLKGLLSLCSDELVSARGALELCIAQMKNVLSSQQLPLDASMEAIGQAYHATETFVQALVYAKGLLKKLVGDNDLSSNSERSRDMDDASVETSSSGFSSQFPDELSELQAQSDVWLGRAELLQSLLGSGIIASLDDIADKESSERLRDRLIRGERYSMAVYTSKKCKIDVFPVWNAWGHALIRMEHYVQARVKFKQALQLHNGSPSQVIQEIINTVESGPPVDVSAVRSLYEHLAESAARILDDSLSADAYLNVLYMPSTFPRSERSTMHHDSAYGRFQSSSSDFDDGPKSNLDDIRYMECIHYLQEYARPDMLPFMFKHGRYADACLLFFPPNAVPLPPQQAIHGAMSPQRPDPLATDYGTIEDLCDFCIGYDAVVFLEDILSARIASVSQDAAVNQYIAAALVRICNYCETHRHFNFLYKFQVIKGDHVAAGLCCLQLFMNSLSLEEAVKHLENAKMHFEEEFSARTGETPKFVSSSFRGKSISGKLSEEGLIRFSACVTIQIDVIKSFNDTDGPQWKHSLFGNPNDPETFRRRCQIAEALAEKNFDMAFSVIYQFNLPAVDIYAGVAAVLAERKRSNQLTILLSNIRGTIDIDDWDQVLGAAINVYANKHKERPDKLIDMLNSSHRKVLACVVCGRLKSAFQIASRSGSVADVHYVAHQALHANALPVLDMCKQWLSQYL